MTRTSAGVAKASAGAADKKGEATPAEDWATLHVRLPRDLYEVWLQAEAHMAEALDLLHFDSEGTPIPLTPSERKTVLEAIAAEILNTPLEMLRS